MPFSPNVDRTDTTDQLARTVNLALADISIMCDERSVAGLEADTWICGWERPVLRLVRKAITPARRSSVDLTRVFDEFFVQVEEDLKTGVSRPETSRRLLRRISSHFDHVDRNASYNRLQNLGCRIVIPSLFFPAFRVVVSVMARSEQVLSPSMSTVLELVRRGVMNQYPGLMSTLFPGEPATVPTLFGSIDAVWSSVQVLATNKTPAISGEIYISSSPLASLSLQEKICRPVVPRWTRGFLSQPSCDE